MKLNINLISILFSLIATTLLAGEYAVIFIDTSIAGEDLVQTLVNIRDVGGDASVVATNNMPIYYSIADTNITGRVVSIRTDGLGVKEWKNMPLAMVETRISKDVKPPSKQKIKVNSMEDFRAKYKQDEIELP